MQNKKTVSNNTVCRASYKPSKLVAKKSCHGQTLINECSISDYPYNFEGLQLALHVILFQTVFCFAFLGSYILTSDQKSRQKAIEIETAFFSFPWESQGSRIGSFLLCFTYLS